MKRLRIVIMSIAVSMRYSHCLAGDATNPPPQPASLATQATDRVDITTRSGLVYRNCKITRAEPDGITVTHAKGIAKIPFEDLPSDVQQEHQYDPEKARAYRQSIAQAQARSTPRVGSTQPAIGTVDIKGLHLDMPIDDALRICNSVLRSQLERVETVGGKIVNRYPLRIEKTTGAFPEVINTPVGLQLCADETRKVVRITILGASLNVLFDNKPHNLSTDQFNRLLQAKYGMPENLRLVRIGMSLKREYNSPAGFTVRLGTDQKTVELLKTAAEL